MLSKVVKAVAKKQKEKKLSETETARMLGISRPTLYLLKKDRRKPELEFYGAVAVVFDDLKWLVYQEIEEIGRKAIGRDGQ